MEHPKVRQFIDNHPFDEKGWTSLSLACQNWIDAAIASLNGQESPVPHLLRWCKRYGGVTINRSHAELLFTEEHFAVETEVMKYIGPRLPEILKGKLDPLNVLFSSGSMRMVEKLYKESEIFGLCNKIVAEVLRSNITDNKSSVTTPLQILEIGAGTGSSFEAVSDVLEGEEFAHEVYYTYSDVSEYFLKAAKSRFHPQRFNLVFRNFDVESKGSLPLPVNYFDIIIATNVLHATSDLDQSLRNINQVLKQDGYFILYELVDHFPLLALTFALLKSWWSFKDPYRQHTDSTLLTPESWNLTLKTHNFKLVHHYQPTSFISIMLIRKVQPEKL